MCGIELRDADGGAAALRDGVEVARLTGRLGDEPAWGRNVWIDWSVADGEDPQLLRDLYARAAAPWVERGHLAHYTDVSADRDDVVAVWFNLSFGLQQVYASRPVDVDHEPDRRVRIGGLEDIEVALELGDLLWRHQVGAPVWSGLPLKSRDALREIWAEALADPAFMWFVLEEDGTPLGYLNLEREDEQTVYLTSAATRTDARGRGIGRALFETALARAYEQGFRTCRADWRATNLLASRFWPRRGFVPTRYRLHRYVRGLAG